MKKALALVLALAMALSLVACGGAASSAAPAPSTAPASSEAAPAAPADGSRPEGYPADDITYINAFAAGSGHDVYFRMLAEKVRENEGWDHSFVVEYAEGASGDVGWTKLAEADPDGYTFGFFPTAALISGVSMGRPYSTEGMDNVMCMMSDPGVIGVAANSPYNTLNELIDACVADPGSVSIGVTSVTTGEGLAVKQMQMASGAQFNIIPFDGETEVLTAVAGGHCDAFCLNVSDCTTFLAEGSIKFLATGDEERSVFAPDIPTYMECGYDAVQVNCRSIGAPAGVDPAIIAYLSECFVEAANDPEIVAKATEMQLPIMTLGTEECNALFESVEQSYKDLWAVQPWQ